MGSAKLFMQECDINPLQGNSGSVIQDLATKKIIGWLDSKVNFNRSSKNAEIAPQADIKAKYFSGTTASCFTEPVFENNDLIAGFINTSSCDWIAFNELKHMISNYESDQLNKALKSSQSLLSLIHI